MARRGEHLNIEFAGSQRVAIAQQAIERAAVGDERIAQAEQRAAARLHSDDTAADRERCAEHIVQIAAAAQMVGMDVGFQDPAHAEAMGAHEREHRIGRVRRGDGRASGQSRARDR